MSKSPAERLMKRSPALSAISTTFPKEGQPAMAVRSAQHKARAPRIQLNTNVSERCMQLLEQLTHMKRAETRDRTWHKNTTIEAALEALAREIGVEAD